MDWHEPAFADYVEKHLLKPGPGGLTAAWRSGHGVAPTGFSTYDSNTLERAWRTLKGLLENRRGTAKIHHYSGGRLEIQPRWLMFATFSKQIWQLASMTA